MGRARRKLGMTSYSYHLAGGITPALSPLARDGIGWFLNQALEMNLDGIQLETSEVDEALVGPFVRAHGLYLELAMGLWSRETLERGLALAARLGARSLRAFLHTDPLAWRRFDADRPRLMAVLAEAAELAQAHGVPLALENHMDYAAWQIAALLSDLRSPHVGICFDSGNPPSSLEDPVEAARAAAPHVIHTHLRDYRMVHPDYGLVYEGVPLGDGCVDLPEVIRVLNAESPAEAYSIESAVRYDPARTPAENLAYEHEGALRSVAYARTALGLT